MGEHLVLFFKLFLYHDFLNYSQISSVADRLSREMSQKPQNTFTSLGWEWKNQFINAQIINCYIGGI